MNQKKMLSKLGYLWQYGLFFLCSPDSSKPLKTKFSYWKCVSRHFCSLICAFNLSEILFKLS